MTESSVDFPINNASKISEGGRIRVLHVDDDACFLKTAKAILEMQGTFQVDTASCVEEAWKKMKKAGYDAVASDFQMPRKDGLQFLKELRAKGNSIPFILFTGKGREEVAIEALNLGADGYYNKVGPPETVYGELAHGIRLAIARRRAELRIWRDEERLRGVFVSSPDAIMVSDLYWNIVDCNEATLKLGGFSSKEEIVGKNSFNFIAEKDRKFVLEKMKHIFDLGTIREVEYTAFKKNGGTYLAETSGSVLKDSAGKPIGCVIVTEDVTERKNAEEALEQRDHSLATLNAVSIELASLPFDLDVREFLTKRLREITGAVAVAFADYDAGNQTLVARLAEVEPGMQEKFTRLLGKSLGKIRCPVSKKDYREITSSVIGKRQTLTEATYGGIPPSVAAEVQKLLGVDRFIGIAYIIEGELYGTSLLAIKVGMPDPSTEMLESFGHMAAVSLRRRRTEETIKESERALRESRRKYECLTQKRTRSITEKQRTLESLRESEEKYRELAESISDVFFAFDKDLRYTYWNKASERLTGIKSKDAVGKSLTEVFPDATGTEIEQVYQNVVKTKKHQVFITKYQLRGEDSVFELNVYPTLNGLSVFVKDVTERKKALERLRVLNEKLGVVGKLTRHDVRNKLSAIVNNIYLAKKMLPDDHKALDYLREIESACKEATRVLDFAAAYESLGVEGLTLMDVSNAVEEAVSLVSELKGVKVVNDCQGLTVVADSAMVQLFFNLIENSLKHGKNVSQIKIHYEEGKDRLKLLYEDDGVGIPKANKPKLFDWGFTTGNGSGYGLPLIKSMMGIYGWTIEEEGEPGKGAKFVITISRATALQR